MSMMATNVSLKDRLHQKLNEEKVKLWLPPYTHEDGSKGEIPQTLVDRYCTELEADPAEVCNLFEEFRSHALTKLAAKRKFAELGIATLKIKLAGQHMKKEGNKQFEVEQSLSSSALDLKHTIARETGVELARLKVICQGHVLEDSSSLREQGLSNGSHLMAICLSQTEAEAQEKQEQVLRLQRTREAAELLSNKEYDPDDGNYYLQITDQTGKAIDMPKEERKALVVAMTLHEKGRAAVKKKNYGEALLLLMEADKEFSKCRADILKAVDNYALVCLDIVWCYLCLKNVEDLPDAVAKLARCDECFRISYGPNLERLALVKGGTGTEKALFMRLHLLQGIVAFHQRRPTEARMLLDRAERELSALQVDDASMIQVMDMGFTQHEARLALRLCEGNVQLAIAHIMQRREEKRELKNKEKEEKRKKKIAKRLGKTANNEPVSVEFYEQLISMGFCKGAAAEALKQSNNDITQALQVLHDHPELLNLPDPDPPEKFHISDEMLAQVTSLGFDAEAACAALTRFKDIAQAVDELLARSGIVPPEWVADALASTSHSSTSIDSNGQTDEDRRREKELIESVIEDIPQDEDDHLDLTLEEETSFLNEYKALLSSST